MKIIVKQDQTIYDVALQYAGSLEAVVSILVANGKANTALLIGEELEIPDVLVARVAGFFNDKGWVPATSPKPLDPDGWVPPAGLDRKVNIFMNGTFLDFVNAPSDLNVVVTDQNDVPIVPISGTVSGGVATFKVTDLPCALPTKSGIAYREPNMSSITNTSYADYDAGWRSQNNAYVNVQPDNPLYFQDLDYTSLDPYNTLKFNNIHGNKHRFTDTLGANTPPTSIASSDFQDHLTGRHYFRRSQAAASFSISLSLQIGLEDAFIPSMDEWWSLKNTKTKHIIINGADITTALGGRPNWTCNTSESNVANAFTVNVADIYPTLEAQKSLARNSTLYVKLMHPISNP